MRTSPRRLVTPLLALVLALMLALPAVGSGSAAQVDGLPELAPESGRPELVVARASEDLVHEMEDRGVDVHHSMRSLGAVSARSTR